MSVDIQSETMIPVRKVPRLLGPTGRNGKYMSIQKVMRGVLEGFDGCKLEAVKLGSHWLTSVEAVQRWVERQAESARARAIEPPALRSPARRRREFAKATAEADRLGL